jgi:hypothetical protein
VKKGSDVMEKELEKEDQEEVEKKESIRDCQRGIPG